MKLLNTLVLPLVLALPLSALAGPKADALATCLSDSTTGKDRKDLSRWIYIAMSAHPDMKPFATVGDPARDQADQTMAKLVTSLLTERCKAEAREAVQQEGSAAMIASFSKLGEVAMQELMTNPDVTRSIGSYERYIDRAKLDAAMSGR